MQVFLSMNNEEIMVIYGLPVKKSSSFWSFLLCSFNSSMVNFWFLVNSEPTRIKRSPLTPSNWKIKRTDKSISKYVLPIKLADDELILTDFMFFWKVSRYVPSIVKQLIAQKFSLLLVWQKVTGLTTLATARILIIFTYVIEGLDFLLSELHDVQHQYVLDK